MWRLMRFVIILVCYWTGVRGLILSAEFEPPLAVKHSPLVTAGRKTLQRLGSPEAAGSGTKNRADMSRWDNNNVKSYGIIVKQDNRDDMMFVRLVDLVNSVDSAAVCQYSMQG
jgi:hypothetical protein